MGLESPPVALLHHCDNKIGLDYPWGDINICDYPGQRSNHTVENGAIILPQIEASKGSL